MYTNENYKNYILMIYQGALYYVNLTLILRFVKLSKLLVNFGNYIIPV